MKRVGLALGGGGIRSMAHIGVLRELARMGVPIDYIAGTSAGAIVGALYAARVSLERMERAGKDLHWRALFEPALLMRRMIPGAKLLQYVKSHLGEATTFERLHVPLAITAVDLTNGRRVVFREGPLLPALRASFALPGAIRPFVGKDGTVFVDGGVLSSVPTEVLREEGCDVIVAVDVRAARTAAPHSKIRWRRTELLLRVGEIMSSYITDISLELADIVLRPEVGEIGSFAIRQAEECIEAGAAAVAEQADRLRALVELPIESRL